MVQRHLTTRIARDDERSQLIDTLRPFLGDVVSGEDELYLTTREVALLLGVSPATVRRWADLTKLRAHRSFGGHRKFPLSEVRSAMNRLVSDGGAPR